MRFNPCHKSGSAKVYTHMVTAASAGRPWVLCALLSAMCIFLPRSSWAGATSNVTAQSWRILEFALNPNGNSLAEVVSTDNGGRPQDQVLIKSLREKRQNRRIYVTLGVHSLIWLGTNEIAFVVPGKKGGIVAENVTTRRTVALVRNGSGISDLKFDASTRRLAYDHTVQWSWGKRISIRVPRALGTLALLLPNGDNGWSSTSVRVVTLGRQDYANKGFRIKTLGMYRGPQLAWKHGKLLVLTQSVSSFRTRILSATTGRDVTLATPLYRMASMSVSPSGRIAVVALGGIWKGGRNCGCSLPMRVYVLGSGTEVHPVNGFAGVVGSVWWMSADTLVAQVMSKGAPYWKLMEVNWRTGRVLRTIRWSHGDLGGANSGCTLDRRANVAVCVAQSLTSPPKLVRVDLLNGTVTPIGAMRYGEHKLNFSFREIHVRNRFGSVSTGFLALPNAASHRAVPLAVMLYGFTEQYSRDAQWITSYPVARFVHAGIAVLMLNWAPHPADPSQKWPMFRDDMESDLSTIQNAVPTVRSLGVKISRSMVMGWSFGGLFAVFAIQRLHEYVAAEVGDPAQWNATEYALGGAFWRHFQNLEFGGPPNRRYVKRYLELDPVADGQRAHGPILFEFVRRNPDAGQLLNELREAGSEVEAFVYRDSIHWLNVPGEARLSRERNLDWAKLNLLGPKSVSAAELRRAELTMPVSGWWTHKTPLGRVLQKSRRRAASRANYSAKLQPPRTRAVKIASDRQSARVAAGSH